MFPKFVTFLYIKILTYTVFTDAEFHLKLTNCYTLEVSITLSARMYAVARLRDDSVETAVLICRVVNCADRAIWFHEAVLSLDNVSVPDLLLALHVSSVVVVDGVLETVFGVGLPHNREIFRN
jgi:hypothetical protein